MRYFITLLILFSCLDGYSQKVAVRLNALPATDGAFGAGVSYGIGNKSTVELAGSLRPWKRSEMYVNRYWLIQPEYKEFVSRNPKLDIKQGVIGIDFGTKSTVVVKQDTTNRIIPVRIGTGDLSSEVKEEDFENYIEF